MNRIAFVFASVLLTSMVIPMPVTAMKLQDDKSLPIEPLVDEELIITGDVLARKANRRLQNAYAAFKKGNFAEAEKQFLSETKSFRDQQLRMFEDIHYIGAQIGAHRRLNIDPTEEERVYGAVLYYMMGLSQARQGKTESAKVSMRKAIKWNWRNIDARLDYALLELQSGNKKKAKKQLKKATELMKKCKDQSAGDCDSLQSKLEDAQFVYANTSVR